MRHFFTRYYVKRNSIIWQEVREEEHDLLPKMRPAHTDAQGQDVRKLRLRLIGKDAKLQMAEGEEEERPVQVRLR